MAIRTAQAVITCNGSVQNLADFITDQHYKEFTVQPMNNNAGTLYMGFTNATGAADHAFRLPGGATAIPPFQWSLGRTSLMASQIYFNGGNNDQFSIGAVAGRD